MGATTVTLQNQFPSGGPLRLITGTIAFSNSYATGGDTCAASAFGCTSLTVLLHDYHKSGLMFSYDYTNGKLQAFYPTGGSVASPTTVNAVPSGAGAAGATPVTSSAATVPVAVTPGVGKEVGATTDLSTITLRFVAYGL